MAENPLSTLIYRLSTGRVDELKEAVKKAGGPRVYMRDAYYGRASPSRSGGRSAYELSRISYRDYDQLTNRFDLDFKLAMKVVNVKLAKRVAATLQGDSPGDALDVLAEQLETLHTQIALSNDYASLDETTKRVLHELWALKAAVEAHDYKGIARLTEGTFKKHKGILRTQLGRRTFIAVERFFQRLNLLGDRLLEGIALVGLFFVIGLAMGIHFLLITVVIQAHRFATLHSPPTFDVGPLVLIWGTFFLIWWFFGMESPPLSRTEEHPATIYLTRRAHAAAKFFSMDARRLKGILAKGTPADLWS